MDITTYYSANKEVVLKKAHQIVICACGERVKYGATGSHTKHSPRHHIYEQMMKSVGMKQ
jgi:hypothetical protein